MTKKEKALKALQDTQKILADFKQMDKGRSALPGRIGKNLSKERRKHNRSNQ